MEELGGGATRLRYQRNRPSSDRLLGTLRSQSPSPTPPFELSEHDIFNTPSGSSSPTHPGLIPNPTRSHNGILAALNDNLKTRSKSDIRPVFNHKASTSASLSSSSSTSPSTSSRTMMIPRRPPPPPPVDRSRLQLQSAPVNVPAMPMRRGRDLEEAISEDEEEDRNGLILPPHEMVAVRDSPLLACSVLEGEGRTLKGRDQRQVRNAVWRQIGFID